MPVVLDQRPMHVLLARKGLPFAALALIAFVTWWAVKQDAPTGLSMSGWHAIIVFTMCLILWVSQLLPLAVTAILGLALLPLLDVLPVSANICSIRESCCIFYPWCIYAGCGCDEIGIIRASGADPAGTGWIQPPTIAAGDAFVARLYGFFYA